MQNKDRQDAQHLLQDSEISNIWPDNSTRETQKAARTSEPPSMGIRTTQRSGFEGQRRHISVDETQQMQQQSFLMTDNLDISAEPHESSASATPATVARVEQTPILTEMTIRLHE